MKKEKNLLDGITSLLKKINEIIFDHSNRIAKLETNIKALEIRLELRGEK